MGGLLSRLNEEKKSEKSSTSTSSILEGASTQVLSSFEKLKEKVHTKLIDDMPAAIMAEQNLDKKRAMLRDRIGVVISEESPKLNIVLSTRENELMTNTLIELVKYIFSSTFQVHKFYVSIPRAFSTP